MNPSTLNMLRAHLLAACIAAMCIQVVALFASFVLGVDDAVFATVQFRALVLMLVAGAVWATRRVAGVAYSRAVLTRHATGAAPHAFPVAVSPDCPLRELVVLHLQFSRTAFYMLER
ncbi:hypothetical protein [Paraburkholderia sp.]|uniref:hypothetical protein n=1 Tax=Paraburkholderia sp. TaxID=1926495 RepID=UPI002390C575|nr:hypothetical protein [Paraburkholderia sp.]MDE1179870.1 hypothetical protein [Paraburkholderia sp.]